MKIKQILSASVLAGAVLLSASGCSLADNNDDPNGTAVATPTAIPTEVDPAAQAADVEDILLTLSGYYNYVAQPDGLEKLKSAEAAIVDRPLSDEAVKAFSLSPEEGFKYFDLSTDDKIKNAYKTLVDDTAAGQNIPLSRESVTITGDTAAVKVAEGKDDVNLVQKEDGSWVIVAKQAASAPSAP